MHRFLAEVTQKPQCNQIQIAVEEAVQTKLTLTVFACLMLHYFLCDTVEACIFCKVWNVTMHLSIDFNVLYDGLFIGFQSTIKVVKIMNTTDLSCRSIEEFSGQCL